MKLKGFFQKHLIWTGMFVGVVGSLIAGYISGPFNLFLNKILSLILTMRIPDIVILIIILGIFRVLWNLNKKFKGLSPERFKELQADNHRMQKHNEQLIEVSNNLIKASEKLSGDYSTLKTHHPELFDGTQTLPPLAFRNNAYWKNAGDSEPEGPFCPRYYDRQKKQMHMIKGHDSFNYTCPACDLRVARPLNA